MVFGGVILGTMILSWRNGGQLGPHINQRLNLLLKERIVYFIVDLICFFSVF